MHITIAVYTGGQWSSTLWRS